MNMSRYFSLSLARRSDFLSTQNGIIDDYDIELVSAVRLLSCKRIGSLPVGLQFQVSTANGANPIMPAVLWNPMNWIIVNEDLANRLFDCAANDVEMLPVDVQSRAQSEKRRYFVLNCLSCFPALCQEKTVFSKALLGTNQVVLRLVINANLVPQESMIFRCVEAVAPLIVSKAVADLFRRFAPGKTIILPVKTA